MQVGFLNNQIDNRGTGNAIFDYAHYNETLLGNQSVIYTLRNNPTSIYMLHRLINRFGTVYSIDDPREVDNVDVLYHIKYGNDDGLRTRRGVLYAVHAVFAVEPHGDRYAAISEWLAGDRVPFVPHIVHTTRHTGDLRKKLGIPQDAIVFGRHGGRDTFDISWVWEAIHNVLNYRDDIYFLFANTDNGYRGNKKNVIFVDELSSPEQKTLFINTCDYMLHARHRGETFGIAVGEFAIKGKPILTWDGSGERAHLSELAGGALPYANQQQLEGILQILKKPVVQRAYTDFTPHKVMQKFKNVFLRG